MDAQHTERNVVAAALHNLRVQITLKALRTDVEIAISNELVCSNQDIVSLTDVKDDYVCLKRFCIEPVRRNDRQFVVVNRNSQREVFAGLCVVERSLSIWGGRVRPTEMGVRVGERCYDGRVGE